MSIKKLEALVPPPRKPSEVGSKVKWEDAQRKLGVSLPGDYVDYINSYGSGSVAGFIRVLNPFSKDEFLSLVSSVTSICDVIRQMKQSEDEDYLPFGLYPTTPGLLPWGTDDNGNFYFWLTKGDAKKWPVIVVEGRGPLWQRFDLTMTAFLAAGLSKKLKCKIWPNSFPGARKSFEFIVF